MATKTYISPLLQLRNDIAQYSESEWTALQDAIWGGFTAAYTEDVSDGGAANLPIPKGGSGYRIFAWTSPSGNRIYFKVLLNSLSMTVYIGYEPTLTVNVITASFDYTNGTPTGIVRGIGSAKHFAFSINGASSLTIVGGESSPETGGLLTIYKWASGDAALYRYQYWPERGFVIGGSGADSDGFCLIPTGTPGTTGFSPLFRHWGMGQSSYVPIEHVCTGHTSHFPNNGDTVSADVYGVTRTWMSLPCTYASKNGTTSHRLLVAWD